MTNAEAHNRIDRLEGVVEQIVFSQRETQAQQRELRTIVQQIALQQQQAQVERQELRATVQQLALQQQQAQAQQLELRTTVQQLALQQQQTQAELRSNIEDGVRMIGTITEGMQEMQSEVRGLQVENRRILDYLLNQRDQGDNRDN